MNVRSQGRWTLAAATLLGLAGCHHNPYGHSPYNYGPYSPSPIYGPTMAPNGGYMSPGPTYTPTPGYSPTTPYTPTPLPGNPNSPTPINPSPTAPIWRPDPGSGSTSPPLNDAPPFQPNRGGGGSLVPDPLEPDFGAPPPSASLPRAVPLADARPVPARAISTPAGADDFFEEPRRVIPSAAGADPFAHDGGAANNTSKPQDPYGYDGQHYAWLRGIVDYDPATRTWSIIYDLTPDVGDKFGGSFVFSDHPSLKGLRPGSLVLAKGRVDPGRTDHIGKALYEVQQIVHLAPPAGIQ